MSLSTLCHTCQQALCQDLLEAGNPDEERCGPHHATQKAFLGAISRKCVICNTAKKIIERRGRTMSNIPSTDWIPWSYEYRLFGSNIMFQIRYGISNGYGIPHSSEQLLFNLLPDDVHSFDSLGAACTYFCAEPGASSASALQLVLHWINDCSNHHPVCRQLQEKEAWWPTRLIDLGDGNRGVWKIVSLPRRLLSPPTYLTLSYRWGTTANLRLSKRNLRSFQDGLPILSLPRTFQDAIIVAQEFSVRFLWIDALCIIQDCSDDWDRESRTMRRVYANALCNLAAVASHDSNGGLFRTRNHEDLRPSLVQAGLNATAPLKTYYAVDQEYMKRHVLDSELMKRGWVFQERLLCPRVLYFAEEQVFWECFVDQRCETFPHGIPGSTSSKSNDLSIIMDLKGRGPEPEEGFEVTWNWQELVERYTTHSLTKASDKLFAMEGIADLFRSCFHDEYIFGLWKTNLVPQLGFFVQHLSSESSSGCLAPSWSWASLQSPVRFPPYRIHMPQYLSFLNFDASERVLSLGGRLIHTKIDRRSAHFNFILFEAGGSRTYGQIFPDSKYTQDNIPERVTILPLLSHVAMADSLRPTLDCLVLEPILVTKARNYRRIALLTMDRGQDLSFFGIKVDEDGSGTMEEGAFSNINLL